MSIYRLPAALLTELVVQSDNPNLAVIDPRLTDLVYKIMPRRLVQALIAHDRVATLEHLSTRYLLEYNTEHLIGALEAGAIGFVKRYYLPSKLPVSDALRHAAVSGNLELVKYLWERLPTEGRLAAVEQALVVAAQHGHQTIVEYLYQIAYLIGGFSSPGRETLQQALELAGDSGNLELLKWLIDRLRIEAQTDDHQVDPEHMLPSETIRRLITHGHYEALKWLFDHGYFADPEERYDAFNQRYSFIDVAVGMGRDDISDLIAQYDGDEVDSPDMALAVAFESGYAELIDAYYDEYYQDYLSTTDYDDRTLARRGHLAALEVVALHGHRLDGHTLVAAIKGGQLAVVQWLLDPPDEVKSRVKLRVKGLTWALKVAIKHERPAIFRLIQARLDPAAQASVLRTLARHGSVYLMNLVFQTVNVGLADAKSLLDLARRKNNYPVVDYLESRVQVLEAAARASAREAARAVAREAAWRAADWASERAQGRRPYRSPRSPRRH